MSTDSVPPADQATALIHVARHGHVTIIGIDRSEVRNAVDRPTAEALALAFREFDSDPLARVAVFASRHGTFCAGADLKAMADERRRNRLAADGDGPMGPSRFVLSKPVIAAIEGHAVAGGLELALWCDLRVVAESAILGVFCRRFGVPLIDGGTVRLPRLIGLSRALDLILTGRAVHAEEALQIGLANRITPDGQACACAVAIAEEIAAFPQTCLRSDRASTYEQVGLSLEQALASEFSHGMRTIESNEAYDGAAAFAAGAGRHGAGISRRD